MTARLTPLGVMLLALLREGDMHPYEMRRLLLERHDDRLVPTTTGAVYNAVSRLEAEHLVVEVGVDRDGRRPERTTYRLTETGTEAVTAWVRRNLDTVGRPAEFRVALAESHNLPLEEVIGLLARRRSTLATLAAEQRAGLDKAGTRGVPPLFLLEIERDQHLLEADLAWLDGLLDRLRGHEIDWLHAVVGDGRATAGRAQPESPRHDSTLLHATPPEPPDSDSARSDSAPRTAAQPDTPHSDSAQSDSAHSDSENHDAVRPGSSHHHVAHSDSALHHAALPPTPHTDCLDSRSMGSASTHSASGDASTAHVTATRITTTRADTVHVAPTDTDAARQDDASITPRESVPE